MLYRKPTPWYRWLGRVVLVCFVAWICVYLVRLVHISHEIDIRRAHVHCLEQRGAGDHSRICEEPTDGR
jgi:hypothetical protein